MSGSEEGFLLTFPLYAYLIEPGPRPGLLGNPEHEVAFLPIWTDADLFETYLERSGLSGKVSGLVIHSVEELRAFLRQIPKNVTEVVVDPNPVPKPVLTSLKVTELLKSWKQ